LTEWSGLLGNAGREQSGMILRSGNNKEIFGSHEHYNNALCIIVVRAMNSYQKKHRMYTYRTLK
jgi:hypothetical protein